jgi:hypothetical protein
MDEEALDGLSRDEASVIVRELQDALFGFIKDLKRQQLQVQFDKVIAQMSTAFNVVLASFERRTADLTTQCENKINAKFRK